MNLTQYIPTGRTSLVKKDGTDLQVQTEYAYRPYPRLTTTIIHNGQVLHKIEKKLDKPVESFEEQSVMENRMKKQHGDVVQIIKTNDTSSLLNKSASQPIPTDPRQATQESTEKKPAVLNIDVDTKELSIVEQIKALESVRYVYQLNLDGEFVNKIESNDFEKSFSTIFKSISDLIDIFAFLPGVTFTRECGVYEVEKDKLYLVSAGDDIYFVLLENASTEINFEKVLKDIITPSYFK